MESTQAEEKLFQFLEKLGIETITYRHAPVFTVDESQEHCSHIEGGHTKNLFVRDKKKRFALVVVTDSRKVDLRSLSDQIGLGRLSFASSDRLTSMLGVKPGSVTPFSLVNAQVSEGDEPRLKVVLDAAMMKNEKLNYHPLHNAATTTISPEDLLTFIRACGYEPEIVDMD